jgi:multidrug transporter EmrE-like cation transporter
VGIISAKLWNINKNPIFLVTICLLFAGAGYMFAKSLKYEGIGITNAIWTSVSAILVVVTGYFLFKENITPIQIAGILVISVGLVLINLK